MWPECATNPDGLALLRAAVANPLEETPRWVLADWLQERGEEQVAEALRESLRVHAQVSLPTGVRDRWTPWEACEDGWLGALSPTPAELSALCADPPATAPWITGLDLSCTEVTDAEVTALTVLKHLTTLALSETFVTEAGVTELAALTSLSALYLGGCTEVTDAGATELAALTNLTDLELSATAVTDAGVTALLALKHLTTLGLGYTGVTPAGLRELAVLKHLTNLNLHGTGLTELAALTQLTALDLGRTEVTDAGVRELQQALPKCKISR